jgi:hypothetical protein
MLASLSTKKAATPNRRFKFNKSSQLFIRMHNETLSIVAMRACNKDRSPVGIHCCDTAQLLPALLRLSAMISQYRTRFIVPQLHSTQQ